MDYSAVGQTTHLAARMEQLARPGATLLTADTLRLSEGYIEVTPLGPVPLKGLADPIEVYELAGLGLVRSRLGAAAARGLTRFVGRDAELEQLRQALGHAGAGHGQLVAIVGEPGVGKSRLVWEVTHSHRTHGWLVLHASSVSYGKATPYLPVIDLLKAYFQIEDRDDPRRMREKVMGKLLALDRSLEPSLPAFLALLDVSVEDESWEALDPPQRRQRTLEAIKRLLLREEQGQPLLLVFEDLHWIDSETPSLLDSLIDGLPTARVLLLVNYRPEYRHGWGSRTFYTQLRLDPLPPDDSRQLGWVSVAMSHNHWMMDESTPQRLFAERALAIAETLADGRLQVAASCLLGTAYFDSGEYRRAEDVLRTVVASLDDDLARDPCGLHIFPAVLSRAWLARALAECGAFDQGIVCGKEALRIAEALGHSYSLTQVFRHFGYLYSLKGEFDPAAELLERGLGLLEGNFPLASAILTGNLGDVYARWGRVTEGLAQMLQALQAREAMGTAGTGFYYSLLLVHLGNAYVLANRLEDARASAGRALTLVREQGEEAYALRSSARSPRRTILSTPRPPPPTTDRLWRTPPTSACAPSSPTVTSASASSTVGPGTTRRPRST